MRSSLVTLACAPLLLLAACDNGGPPPPADGGTSSDAGPMNDGGGRDGGTGSDAGSGGNDAGGTLSDVHFIGRFDFSDGASTPWFAWPGTQIVARFRGTSISVRLDDGGESFFDVWIDDVRQPVIDAMGGPTTYDLASGLTDGEHVVRIARRTESFFGRTQFLGFPGATLVPSPPPYAHLVEIIGDSITCGYGVLGDVPTCSFSADTESEPDAYGAVAARTLGVAHAAIAYSGRGVYRNYGGAADPLMPELYARRLAEFDTDPWDYSYTPDVVVITLGTNDFSMGDPGTPFADALDAFVQTLRGHYPSAVILLGTSPMLGGSDHATHRGYLQDVVTRAAGRGDSHVSIVEFDEQSAADGIGCDYHPGVTTQANMAGRLVAAIQAATGW
ncbi:MAG: SGNH/GDSL hydrolase family protein [Sandaracinus sp.]